MNIILDKIIKIRNNMKAAPWASQFLKNLSGNDVPWIVLVDEQTFFNVTCYQSRLPPDYCETIRTDNSVAVLAQISD